MMAGHRYYSEGNPQRRSRGGLQRGREGSQLKGLSGLRFWNPSPLRCYTPTGCEVHCQRFPPEPRPTAVLRIYRACLPLLCGFPGMFPRVVGSQKITPKGSRTLTVGDALWGWDGVPQQRLEDLKE